jgi:glycosyltransferase involved in cell wall biosynthesis
VGIDVRPGAQPAPWCGGLLAVAAAVATVPPALVGLDAPSVSPTELAVPPCGAVVLAGTGLIVLGVSRLHALGARVALVVGLAGAAVMLCEGVAIGAELGPVPLLGPVYGAAGGAVAGAGLLGVLVRWRWRAGAAVTEGLRARLLGAGVVVALLAATRASIPAWVVAVAAIGLALVGLPWLTGRIGARITAAAPDGPSVPVAAAVGGTHLAEADPDATIAVEIPDPVPALAPVSLRVLHLGLPDPGESTTPAVDLTRRLAAEGHRITVLGPRRPGVADRVEHHGRGWVHWTHHGLGRGRTRVGRLVTYAVAAVVAARRVEADVVVEEIAAPLGSLAAPRWARRPTVAVAASLPAPLPADRWVPLLRLRWWAVRTHRSVIARSPAAAEALAAAGSRAHVALVGEGIDPAALRTAPSPRGDDVVVRVGRLGLGTEHLGLLVHAWAQAAPRLTGRLVLLDPGRHEDELRRWVARLGLADRVEFATEGHAPHAHVASARLAVVVPGAPDGAALTAALEALAVGTPVLAGDTAVLREVVSPAVGVLVPATGQYDPDTTALARALCALHADGPRRAAAAAQGPAFARVHDRDVMVGHTEDVYLAATARG